VHLCCLADGATAFKREVFQRVGYYDDNFFCWQHGPDLSIRMLGAGYKIRFGDKIVIDHFEKHVGFRPLRAFYDFRNLAWLNIKHFSLVLLPLLLLRNFVSLCALPFRQKSLRAPLHGLAGYVVGWATFLTPLRKRRVPSFAVQKKFLLHFVFNRFPNE
jgi:GT2 family glycosyltransferase